MDLVKLYPSIGDADTELSQGELIRGHTSVIWTERYQKSGEFKIEAPLSSNFKNTLPIGTFVTHVGTKEVMMVENHEITQAKDADPTIVVSGRDFSAYLEERILGGDQGHSNNTIPHYVLTSDETWNQIVALIFDHFVSTVAGYELPGVDVMSSCSGAGTSEQRELRYGNIYERVQELLQIDDVGIRTIRPTPTDPIMYWDIYQGENRSDEVYFSWTGGDVDELKYLFSSKKHKTHARVMGRWVQKFVVGTAVNNYDRRILLVEASDIDQDQNAMPTGGALTLLVAAMNTRGLEALKTYNSVTITSVDVAENARYQFRRDYNLGDLVTVDGDFGQSAVMRVTEFAEVDDENGVSGHPTLSIPGED